MKFYFGFSTPAKRPEVMSVLQQVAAVGGDLPQAAAQVIIDRITAAFGSGVVDTDSFYQVLVVFALAMACSKISPEPIFDLADESGTPIRFSKEGEWLDFMHQTKAIPSDRVAEAHEILLAYGVVQPMLDISGLGAALHESAGDFCL